MLAPLDWLSLLHPVLAVLFIYPVAGTVVRLGLLARERRTGYNKLLPPTVGTEHWEHGRWLTGGVVLAVLIAFAFSFLKEGVEPASHWWLLALAWCGSLAALVSLWVVKTKGLRASFALLTWAGILGLGSQPQIYRLSDQPFTTAFWSSHYWAGVLLTGLLLFNLAVRPEIQKSAQMLRLHISANVLVLLLLAVLGISGSRDLLLLGGL
ncbi:MAG: DUF4079 domain-containing protein [Synechococcus lacustris]